MNLSASIRKIFSRSLFWLLIVLFCTWITLGTFVFRRFVEERREFLALIVDSHHDQLISGNWRTFLESTRRLDHEYFKNVLVCWSSSNECVDRTSLNPPNFLTTKITITVPPNGQSIISVVGDVVLKRPVELLVIVTFSFSFVIIMSLWLLIRTKDRVNNQVQILSNLGDLISNDPDFIKSFPEELKGLGNKIIETQDQLRQLTFETAESIVQLRVAAQVSHDIRSPLAALEMISMYLSEVAEDKRIIIRNGINRIRDIVNTLSAQKSNTPTLNEQNVGDLHSTISSENVLLTTVVETIVTEKRIEYREYLNVEIFYSQTLDNYGLFANLDIQTFKRVMSNIINNSVDALSQRDGRIEIAVSKLDEDIIVSIKDNGIGIPTDRLKQLGLRGASFAKAGGSGLGLWQAAEFMSLSNGSLSIDSDGKSGTVVNLTFPSAVAPDWFVRAIRLKLTTTLIFLDDDQAIHHVWRTRFESLIPQFSPQNFHHFSTIENFKSFFSRHFADLEDALFLIDYEFLNKSQNGLDLIEQLGIFSQSILVTSRYEELIVRERCEKLNVKLIPKSMSGFVPILSDSR